MIDRGVRMRKSPENRINLGPWLELIDSPAFDCQVYGNPYNLSSPMP